MEPIIRPASEADRAAIASVLQSITIFSADQVTAALDLFDQSFAHPKRGEYLPFVAQSDGLVVGMILYGPMPLAEGVFDLYWIAVHPTYEGRGIGRDLLRFVERAVVHRGGRMLLIETSSKDSYERTRQFYEKSGYREISRIKDFYRVEHDKIVFSKEFRG